MLVVIDTNVFVRAIYYKDSYARNILRLVDSGQLPMLSCVECAEECVTTVAIHARTRGVTKDKLRSVMKKLFRLHYQANIIEIPGTYKGCEDPDDDKFIELALVGNADYIISTDHHLSSVEIPVSVLSPWQYILKEESFLGKLGKVNKAKIKTKQT